MNCLLFQQSYIINYSLSLVVDTMFKNRKIKKLFKKLELNLNNQNLDEALIIVNKILSLDENNINALYYKALILYNKCEYAKSLSILNFLLNINYCVDALLLKGRIYCVLNEYENSLDCYKEASFDFDLEKINKELAYYAEHPSLFDEGIHTKLFIGLCNIILDNMDIIEVRLFKAYVLSEIGHNENALNNVNYVLARDPLNEKALYLKSSILININQYDNALAVINKGLDLYPENIQFLNEKSRLFYELSNYDESEKLCDKFNSLDDFGNYYLLSKIKYKKGDYALALKNIDIAIEKFFENPIFDDKTEFSYVYYWYKALILSKLSQFDEANKIIDCLLEKEESAKNYCLKSMILYEMKDYENALMFVNKALDLKPDCKQAIELKEKIETL